MRSFCRTLALTKVILTDEHIYIKLADFADCQKICDMQRIAFYDILTRYRDYDTNPVVKRWK